MNLSITLTGTRPLLQHNARLANPTDPYVQRLKEFTAKKKKTQDDHITIMRLEARGGAYETPDNLLGLPTENVLGAIRAAATKWKLGMSIARALDFEDGKVEPIHVSGSTVDVDKYLTNIEHIDYRSVVVQRNRTMRARPIIRDWSSIHHFELATAILDYADLPKILKRAGEEIGIGDFTPRFGRFTAEIREEG